MGTLFSPVLTFISPIGLEWRKSSRAPSFVISRAPPRRRTPYWDQKSSLEPWKWILRGPSGKLRRNDAAPSNCPDGKLFVPACTQSQVIQWEQSSRLSGRPGTNRTISFIQHKFWCPEMREDLQKFVSACSVCAQSKVMHQPPQGLFATTSHSKLPSASETTQLLILHLVRLHGIPTDKVSDRGPQFTVRFWKAFCTLISTSVSLLSGFHPQSNGQTERPNQSMETMEMFVY